MKRQAREVGSGTSKWGASAHLVHFTAENVVSWSKTTTICKLMFRFDLSFSVLLSNTDLLLSLDVHGLARGLAGRTCWRLKCLSLVSMFSATSVLFWSLSRYYGDCGTRKVEVLEQVLEIMRTLMPVDVGDSTLGRYICQASDKESLRHFTVRNGRNFRDSFDFSLNIAKFNSSGVVPRL
jgi:hypothetical protein